MLFKQRCADREKVNVCQNRLLSGPVPFIDWTLYGFIFHATVPSLFRVREGRLTGHTVLRTQASEFLLKGLALRRLLYSRTPSLADKQGGTSQIEIRGSSQTLSTSSARISAIRASDICPSAQTPTSIRHPASNRLDDLSTHLVSGFSRSGTKTGELSKIDRLPCAQVPKSTNQ